VYICISLKVTSFCLIKRQTVKTSGGGDVRGSGMHWRGGGAMGPTPARDAVEKACWLASRETPVRVGCVLSLGR
jgi:hypothetical protein